MTAFLFLWAPVLLWSGAIYYVSGIPSLDSGWGLWDFILRKIAHMVEFGVLCGLLLRAISKTWPALTKRAVIIISASLAVLYAMSDEFHQSFVPGRTMAGKDVLIDSVGIVVMILFYRRCQRKHEA